MIKKLITLFKLGRKVAKSDILNIASKFKKPPLAVTILFQLLSISFSKKEQKDFKKDEGERLSSSLENMGTTFIKLGQFLATRPDIIGEELSSKLENLQDRLPAFSINQAKEIIRNDLGDETYNSIIDLSEPVAAASIAQVHKAKINDDGTIKDVAIKILRPDIKKIFNEEIDAMMLFAFIIESFIKKTKRLKLHMARSFFNCIAMLSFFYSLSIAPLADVASLAFTAPLFASILAVIFLKEIVGIKRIIAIILGFIGALIIIDPVYSSINNGHILVLLSASVWSVSLIIIKVLGRTESSVTITSYMVIIMIPLSAIAAFFYWKTPTLIDLFYLMIIGVCGTGAQMLLAQALRQGDTSIIMPFDFLKLIWAVGIGYLFFFEIPSVNTWVGSIIIFLSTLYIAYREKVLSKKTKVKNITQPVDQ